MTERASFYRKIRYLVALAVLAIPIYWLSTPATAISTGGRLAQLREEKQLGQSNMGEVDPASETMRFLTLGLRGVAVTALWEKTHYYKKTEDWTNLTATLEQLAKLQPNFITFWKYQAWNLTYNVSVEFDDYRDRYYYVMRGIKFLMEGVRYNHDNPQLLSDLGWFFAHKIGRADEKVQYRRLFKADPDIHPADRTPDERDNWLVSKEWYQKAIDAVDIKGKPIGRKNPREFYSDPAKSQINYAEAIGEEGYFDKSLRAWVKGGDEWRAFGQRPIKHSSGVLMRLGDEPRLVKQSTDLRAELDAMSPGARNSLLEEKKKPLTPEQLKVLDMPRAELTAAQYEEWSTLQSQTAVTDRDVAGRIARDLPQQAKDAWKLLRRLEDTEIELNYTRSYKETANFDYWQLRCDFEQTENAVDARRAIFAARRAMRGADVEGAKKLYLDGFRKWRLVIDEFPALLEDETVFGDEDVIQNTKRYRDVLDQLRESLDESYPLWDALEKFDKEGVFAAEIAKHKQTQAPGEKAKDPAAKGDSKDGQ